MNKPKWVRPVAIVIIVVAVIGEVLVSLGFFGPHYP